MLTDPKEYYPPMHTAEHILNRAMINVFKTDRLFSNHIERKKSKCDYYFTRNLTNEELQNLEDSINSTIKLNLNIAEEIFSTEEAKTRFNLNNLPQDHDSKIRIINVGSSDSCPCSGVHVKNTSKIGNIKIISSSLDNSVLRVRFKLSI